jgi:hypothetical protein
MGSRAGTNLISNEVASLRSKKELRQGEVGWNRENSKQIIAPAKTLCVFAGALRFIIFVKKSK